MKTRSKRARAQSSAVSVKTQRQTTAAARLKNRVIYVSFPKEVVSLIDKAAASLGKSRNDFIIAAIEAKLSSFGLAKTVARSIAPEWPLDKDGCLDDVGIHLASQAIRLAKTETREAAAVMLGLAKSIRHHPHYRDVAQAMLWLADGIGCMEELVSIVSGDTDKPEYVALSQKKRWAGDYFSFLIEADVHLETTISYLEGLGEILTCDKDMEDLGEALVKMSVGYDVLLELRNKSGLETVPGEKGGAR